MILNIKGQNYKIFYSYELFDAHTFDEGYPKESYVDGYCDTKQKEIYLYIGENNKVDTTCLHELIHAYLFESGLHQTCENEFLCDFFAGNILSIVKQGKTITDQIEGERK